MSDPLRSARDLRDELETERTKAFQVAKHGEPAAKWWAAHFLTALDAFDQLAQGTPLLAVETPTDEQCDRILAFLSGAVFSQPPVSVEIARDGLREALRRHLGGVPREPPAGPWRSVEFSGDHEGYDGRGKWRVTRGVAGEIYWFRTEPEANAVRDALNLLLSRAPDQETHHE